MSIVLLAARYRTVRPEAIVVRSGQGRLLRSRGDSDSPNAAKRKPWEVIVVHRMAAQSVHTTCKVHRYAYWKVSVWLVSLVFAAW